MTVAHWLVRRHVDGQLELLRRGKRLDRTDYGVDHVTESVVAQTQRELSGLDLGQVQQHR